MTQPETDPDPSIDGEVKIGISSWSDLPGFYPMGIKAKARLPWYARHFDIVEVNTSFYRNVSPRTYQIWLDQTPASLTFDVKAFRELTHERPLAPLVAYREFRDSLQPLRDAQRLGAVLFQYPPGFTCTPANRNHIAALPTCLPGDRIAVEFRHASWLDEEHRTGTIGLLRECGIALVVVDEPSLPPNTVPLVSASTSESLAYVRLHGRNATGWNDGREHRYAYAYSSVELNEIVGIVRELTLHSRQVHVFFNNNSTGAGTRNAQQLAELLGVSTYMNCEQPLLQATLL